MSTSLAKHITSARDIGAEPMEFDSSWYVSAYPDVAQLGLDPLEHYERYGRALGRRPLPPERVLKRVVLVVPDLSTIGGISSRTRTVLSGAQGREIEFKAITARSERGGTIAGELCYAADPDAFVKTMEQWRSNDTAMVISNNAIRSFPRDIRDRIQQFPIVYLYAGQLAFMLQDSTILKDRQYAKKLTAMRLMAFSEDDINFQRQLGIHGQVKGFAPVKQRVVNGYHSSKNTRLGYVGRIDFHAKDSAKLLEVADHLRGSKWGPIKIFTTDGRNSPKYQEFRAMARDRGLESEFEFVLNERDKTEIFKNLACLLVPSKKESFGNSVVESMSFGVPVVAASYAPGPAEIIEHGKSGLLLDSYAGSVVAEALKGLTSAELTRMSGHAFERHKRYRIEDHIDQLEKLSREAVADFRGENVLRVFPDLKILED